MPAYRIVRSLGRARVSDASKPAGDINFKKFLASEFGVPAPKECFFKSEQREYGKCAGKRIVTRTQLGAMCVCQAHQKIASEFN